MIPSLKAGNRVNTKPKRKPTPSFLTPNFITALAALIGAVTGLLKVFL